MNPSDKASDQAGMALTDEAPEQQTLSLTDRRPSSLEDLELRLANPQLFAHIGALLEPSNLQQVLFWGRHGSGRTSLLEAACSHFRASGAEAQRLDCAGAERSVIDRLQTLSETRIVAVDNLERLTATRNLQEQMLGYWQERSAQDSAFGLLLAAAAPPAELGLLPDLISRLQAGAVYRLRPLNESQRVQALRRHAEEQAMALDEQTAAYMIRHSRQDVDSGIRLLKKVADRSLREKRPVSLALVREVLRRL